MACIKLATLQLPKDRGGMAVPHPQTYYFVAQLQHFTGWDLATVSDSSRVLLMDPNTSYTILSHMEMGFPTVISRCPTIQLQSKLKHRLGLTGFLSQTPIWHDRYYKDLTKFDKQPVWEKVGIEYFTQVINNSVMKPYPQMVLEFPLLKGHYYQYIQLHHAIRCQGRYSDLK